MTDKLQFLDLDSPAGNVRIATLQRSGRGPAIVWLGGFLSDMQSTKASALDSWAERMGRACLRFDYSGHGASGGEFRDATISDWLAQSIAVIEKFAGANPVLVGSSMGGWIALLATRYLNAINSPAKPGALVLIAPAVDFTETLMWKAFPEAIRRQLETTGVWLRQSEYSETPYPITMKLIEDGRKHLLYGAPFTTGCPVHIYQGAKDPDVPMDHVLKLLEHLPHDPVTVTIVPEGDHRLSRDEDIAKLVEIVALMAGE